MKEKGRDLTMRVFKIREIGLTSDLKRPFNVLQGTVVVVTVTAHQTSRISYFKTFNVKVFCFYVGQYQYYIFHDSELIINIS